MSKDYICFDHFKILVSDSNTGGCGIKVVDSDYIEIYDCNIICADTDVEGIYVSNGDFLNCYRNIIEGDGNYGIHMINGSQDFEFYSNVIVGHFDTDAVCDTDNNGGSWIYNTINNQESSSAADDSGNGYRGYRNWLGNLSYFVNNIVCCDSDTGNEYPMLIDTTAANWQPPADCLENNCYYNFYLATSSMGQWDGNDKSFAQWKTATGDDDYSYNDDPDFDATDGYHLDSTSSPCYGAGDNSTGIDYDVDYGQRYTSPCIGADEYQRLFLTPDPQIFGPIGGGTEDQNLIVSFYGLSSLSITSTSITTGNWFAITGGGGARTIQAFNTHTITVTFTYNPGNNYDTLVVAHNAGANLTATLLGIGT